MGSSVKGFAVTVKKRPCAACDRSKMGSRVKGFALVTFQQQTALTT